MNKVTYLLSLTMLLTLAFSCGQGSDSKVKTLSATEFEQQLQKSSGPLILDVRTPEEFATGHLEGAINLDINQPDFRDQLTRIATGKPVFVYCKGGGRSTQAVTLMQEAGIDTIYELKGGILSWENSNKLIVGTTAATAEAMSISDYEQLIAEHPLLIVDFNAPWCGPCKEMKPDFELLEQKYAGKVSFAAINVDEAKALSQQQQIEGIPLIVVYKGGQEIKRVMGYQTREQLEALVQLLL